MIVLPAGIGQTFRLAASELGFAGATRLFIRALGETSEAVDGLREALGREYPVLDAMTAHWLEGKRFGAPDAGPIAALAAGCRTVIVVGIEADHLDALVDALPTASFKLLASIVLPMDWERVTANYEGRVEVVPLEQAYVHAGADSCVVCFAYGAKPETLYVPQSWMRFFGRDTRPLFRSLIAWNVVPAPFEVYPRWLAGCPSHDFTDVVTSP